MRSLWGQVCETIAGAACGCITSRMCGGRCASPSSMRATRPAARPPHPFFEFRAHPFDMLASCFVFLHRDGPADPLVAREWREVFPGSQCLHVGGEGIPEVSRKVVHDSLGDSVGHRLISQAKRSRIWYTSTAWIPGPWGRYVFLSQGTQVLAPPRKIVMSVEASRWESLAIPRETSEYLAESRRSRRGSGTPG